MDFHKKGELIMKVLGMICKGICKYGLGAIGECIGECIAPGVGGPIGRRIGRGIGSAIGPEVSDTFTDPDAWAAGMAYKADCIKEYGFDPLDLY